MSDPPSVRTDAALPLAPVELLGGEARVWRVGLDDPPWPLAELWGVLSPAERRRASAFHGSELQRRFVVRRGALRLVVAACVGADAAALTLRRGRHGKPALAVPDRAVCFNAAHTDGVALYAVASRPVGVDVEAVRHLPDARAVAELCCSVRERRELAAYAGAELDAALLHAWTQKEAYLKGVGAGLASSPASVEVTVDPSEPPRLRPPGDGRSAPPWSLAAIPVPVPVPPAHTAVLALRQRS